MGTKIEMVPLSELKEAKRNPKLHSKEIRASIGRFGYIEPIVVDERTGLIVAGHGRREALLALQKLGKAAPPVGVEERAGEWFVPVLKGWASRSDAEAEAYLLASNKLSEAGGWDDAGLANLLADLSKDDALSGVGFSNAEINRLLKSIAPAPAVEQEVSIPDESYVMRGDVWILGRHRLMCGDSTSKDDLSRLLKGERAALCLTDPPYGIGESYASHDDTQANLRALVDGFFPLARASAAVVLLTPGNINQRHYPAPDWTLAWFVPAGAGSGPWGFSCWQPVLAYGKDPYLAAGQGRRPDAIVKTESSDNSLGHPCPKPIGVWTWLMERGSLAGSLVFDPFSGSGTSIAAAEQTGRRCFAMELDPKYVQVGVERWKRLTGKQAVKE